MEDHLPRTYTTLDDIQQRKEYLLRQIDRDNMNIRQLWGGMFVKREDTTKGQFIAGIINNSALIIDAFLMVRKLRQRFKSKR